MEQTFWQLPLDQLDEAQWEALCDGCGRCCLQKFQDQDSEEVVFTQIACEYLGAQDCRCQVYDDRVNKKAGCVVIDRTRSDHFGWLPTTCAYRLRYEDKPLFPWHPLLSGSRAAMVAAGVAVDSWCISERDVPEVRWVDFLLDDPL